MLLTILVSSYHNKEVDLYISKYRYKSIIISGTIYKLRLRLLFVID